MTPTLARPTRVLTSLSCPVLSLRAMSSAAAKEQFLRQMEQIVEGIKQSRIKVQTQHPSTQTQ